MNKYLTERRTAVRSALQGDLSLLKWTNAKPTQESEDLGPELTEIFSNELVQIDAALTRIRNKIYGICVNCEDNISMARLHALPYAERCLDCQREKERKQFKEKISEETDDKKSPATREGD